MVHRSRRIAAGLAAAALLLAGVYAIRVLQAPPVIAIGARAPAIGAPVPGVWIFAGKNCGHCETHLAYLRNVMHAYPDSLRRRIAPRIAVVGEVPPPCASVRVLPDSLRHALHIQWTPETWFVDAAGHVRERWRGARGARAWRRALAQTLEVP